MDANKHFSYLVLITLPFLPSTSFMHLLRVCMFSVMLVIVDLLCGEIAYVSIDPFVNTSYIYFHG